MRLLTAYLLPPRDGLDRDGLDLLDGDDPHERESERPELLEPLVAPGRDGLALEPLDELPQERESELPDGAAFEPEELPDELPHERESEGLLLELELLLEPELPPVEGRLGALLGGLDGGRLFEPPGRMMMGPPSPPGR